MRLKRTLAALAYFAQWDGALLLRGRGMIESNQLTWRTIENGFALHRWQTKTPLLHVVPDTPYPGMWRIRSPDGRLTDMASLTRAKDAAVSIALETLNAGKRGRQSPLEAAPVRPNGVPCPEAGK